MDIASIKPKRMIIEERIYASEEIPSAEDYIAHYLAIKLENEKLERSEVEKQFLANPRYFANIDPFDTAVFQIPRTGNVNTAVNAFLALAKSDAKHEAGKLPQSLEILSPLMQVQSCALHGEGVKSHENNNGGLKQNVFYITTNFTKDEDSVPQYILDRTPNVVKEQEEFEAFINALQEHVFLQLVDNKLADKENPDGLKWAAMKPRTRENVRAVGLCSNTKRICKNSYLYPSKKQRKAGGIDVMMEQTFRARANISINMEGKNDDRFNAERNGNNSKKPKYIQELLSANHKYVPVQIKNMRDEHLNSDYNETAIVKPGDWVRLRIRLEPFSTNNGSGMRAGLRAVMRAYRDPNFKPVNSSDDGVFDAFGDCEFNDEPKATPSPPKRKRTVHADSDDESDEGHGGSDSSPVRSNKRLTDGSAQVLPAFD